MCEIQQFHLRRGHTTLGLQHECICKQLEELVVLRLEIGVRNLAGLVIGDDGGTFIVELQAVDEAKHAHTFHLGVHREFHFV